jgi:hypothetical protein
VTVLDEIYEYVANVNKRRIGVLLLLVLLLLGLGIGNLDDGGDGNGLGLLPESDLEVSGETPTPVTTETPTPTPGGGAGDGTAGDGTAGDETAGDGDGSNSDDIQIENTENTESDTDGSDGSPEDDDQDKDDTSNDNGAKQESEDDWGGGGGSSGGSNGDGDTSTDSQSDYNHDEHLDIEVVGNRLRVEAANVLPGDEGSESTTIRNNGTINGTLLAAFDSINDTENGLTGPEMEAGDDASDGELSEHLRVRLLVNTTDGNTEYLFGNESEYVRLSDIEGTNMTDGVLDVDGNATVTLDWRLPKETDNRVQSDRVTFDLLFYLIHNEQGV